MSNRATSPKPKAKRLIEQKSELKGLISFGANNHFPQDVERLISESVTASACRSVKAEFIEGNGFNDLAFSKMIVHESGITMDQVLNTHADDASWLEGIALHVQYNGYGKICGFKPLPFKKVRLMEPNSAGNLTHAAYCPFLGSTYNLRNLRDKLEYPLFNPDPLAVIEEISRAGGIDKYPGQLLYVQLGTSAEEYYLKPSWTSGGMAVESEHYLDIYHFRIINSGFNISGIYKVLNPTAPAEVDDEGKSIPYDPMRDPHSIENQIADHQGAENGASIVIQRFDSLDEMNAAQFVDTTGASLADRYNATAARVENEITRAWRVPNELVGIRRAGGIAPTGDEIKVASQLMQQTVNRTQRRLSGVYEMLMRNWKTPIATRDFSIENLNYFPENGNATTVPNAG